MRKLLGTCMLAAVLAGCGGSSEPQTPNAAKATPTATAADAEHDLSGYSPGVVEYYGQPHEHEDSEAGNVEEEYHQPPKPAEAKVGETITLTGTEIGVRFDVTVTDVKPAGDLMAVHLELKSTGIAIYDRPLEMASLTYPGGKPLPVEPGAKAKCSNGFDGIIRIDVLRSRKGCLLFPRPAGEMPERFQLALEVVPTIAGGIWNLS